MSKTQVKLMEEWETINWRKVECKVFKLQKRIYQASRSGNVKVLRRLQKTLINSWKAKLLAVRKVTQDNQGKRTPGVDGILIKTGKKRMEMAKKLKIDGKAKPLRRIWIPKPGRTEKRGLGIPTIEDRAKQTLIKLAMEPEWEAKMEPNSYGFRPGRSTQDAIHHIWRATKSNKWVLDADIEKCFDQIDHNKLLDKIKVAPTIRKQIKAWLKAGVLDQNVFNDTNTGTPQGGTISPLLANIALEGMAELIKKAFPYKNRNSSFLPYKERGEIFNTPVFIRYADDFVIIHENKKVIEDSIPLINEWLNEIGLKLKPSKTHIRNLSDGFDFLGFNIKEYKRKGQKSIRLITPSKKAVEKHASELNRIVNKYKSCPQGKLINELNKTIRGWTNYYRTQVSAKIFSRLKNQLYYLLWSWAMATCPRTGKKKLRRKYWQQDGENKWRFATMNGDKLGVKLFQHTDVKIIRHMPLKTSKSPYDGD